MRNGLLGSLVLFVALVAPAPARAEAPSFMRGLDTPWQPPATDLDERPSAGPRGYPVYGCVEYLLWWTERDRPVTALAADAAHPANALLPAASDFGALLQNGGRVAMGYWLDQQQRYALELGGFWVLDRSPTDGGFAGNNAVRTEFFSRLWSGEAQLRGEVYRDTWGHLDLLGGFRFLSLDEGLHIYEGNPGTVSFDSFGTHNRFYGGQLGAEVEVHQGKWFADVWGKIALGATCEAVHIHGATSIAGQVQPGGLVAPAAGAALHGDVFAVLPQAGINAGYQLTNNLRLTAGYTFFYISDAARPGDQIDALLHAPRPLPVRGGEFWGQGVSFGFEFRF
jgi:hypothetical protein